MVLRIHFTADDLAKTSVAAAADPLWEVLFTGFRLRETDSALEYRPWLREVRTQRRPAGLPGVRMLSVLAPLGRYIPDFLTPTEAGDGLDAGLEAVRATPRSRLRGELSRLAASGSVPDWIRPLADGDLGFLNRLADELRAQHHAVVAPYQDLIQDSVDADRAIRARGLLDGGVEGLFASLGPIAQWRPPVLEVDYAVDKDLYLNGRGLRLVPAYFSRRTPDSLADPELPPVLVYPIDRTCRWTQLSGAGGHRSLEALLGGTRAAVLHAVDLGATTTQLAVRLRTSLSSISRHTGVLRDAGLILTQRQGVAVLHTLAPLGRMLLERRAVTEPVACAE